MNLYELFLGQVPEAIYFALFLILTKNLKNKRLLFIVIMTIEYVLSMNIKMFSTGSHVIYTILVFITLKVLYKEKAQITDVFTFGISSLILILISAISFLIFGPDNMLLVSILSRALLFVFLLLFNKKLPKIQSLYKKLWNRNDKVKTKMKSTTFRSLNVVIFNLMFYVINLGMIYALLIRK